MYHRIPCLGSDVPTRSGKTLLDKLPVPMFEVQSAHVLTTRVLAMNETTIKAGPTQAGQDARRLLLTSDF